MVAAPTSGLISQPPIKAPTMPTTIFRRMPSCVRMITLASHPMTPPKISQMRIFIARLVGYGGCRATSIRKPPERFPALETHLEERFRAPDVLPEEPREV